jgi:antirestriction protein
MMTTTTPRIYVACLASYNSGILHGTWIDVSDEDTMQEAIDAMLRSSPCPNVEVEHDGEMVPSAEEWAIHDYELEGFEIGEHESLENVASIGEVINELSGDELEAFIAWKNNDCSELSVDSFRDDYQGCYDDLADYAAQWTEETGGLEGCPEHLKNYIDFESMGRDFQLGGDIWVHDAGYKKLHVFNNH